MTGEQQDQSVRCRIDQIFLCLSLALAASLFWVFPVTAQTFSLDERCVVSVLNRTAQVRPDGTFSIPNVPANFGQVRARATCVQNGQTVSGQSDFFAIPPNGVVTVSNIPIGVMNPIPQTLEVLASMSTLTSVNATVPLTVTGHYANGITQNLTLGLTGTNYTVSNPAIATVNADGIVTAVATGTVLISAMNEGVLGIARVAVVLTGDSDGDGIPDDVELALGLNPLDPIDGFEDLDGDGVTNQDEFSQGTDISGADSDGDGIPDSEESVPGADGFVTNPLLPDTDGDGIWDPLEIQTGSDPTNPNSFNLAQALSSMTITPSSFLLQFNTIIGEASQQLTVTGNLIDGTSIDLTSSNKGTNYASSDLSLCSFGAQAGRVFAGNAGTCTITASNSGFNAIAIGTVRTFSPTPLSFISIPGYANNVDVNGNYAYVAAGSTGLQVVDVGDPTFPRIVASLDTPGNSNDVRVVGNLAYIADGSAGLRIIDIASPTAPMFVGAFDTPGGAYDVAIIGNLALVADGTSGLQLIDVTNPSAPMRLGSVATPGTAKGVDTTGNLAIVADGAAGIHVIDIGNRAAPRIVGTLDTPEDARDVAVNGNIAYVADYVGSLRIIDFTNPASPISVGSTSQSLGGILMDVALAGQFAFGADIFFVNGVPITDVTLSSNPTVRARLDFPARDDNGFGIAVDSSYVYLTAGRDTQENGATADTRLYIGQYLALEDTAGIPPSTHITSPGFDDTLIEGTTIPITVDATDDFRVVSVNFVVNGQVVFTDTTAPYQFNFAVPVGLSNLTISATAVDLGGNVGLASDVQVHVIPDPGTTVVGSVVDKDGNPVAGATVTASDGHFVITGADGVFSIPGVSTILGDIIVSAKTTVNGQLMKGESTSVTPVRGGTTDVGNIALRSCTLPPAGLVSWWSGDGSANDIIDAHPGTLQNGATFTAGLVEEAFHFDGVDDFVSIASSATLNISGPLTVEAWFNLSDIPINFPAVVTKGPTNAQYLLFVNGLTGDASGTAPVCFRINTGPNNPTSRFNLNLQTICSISKATFGQYMHVAGVFEGDSIKIYVNGLFEASLPVAGTIASDDRPLIIGAGDGVLFGEGLVNRVHGIIDEISIYNRALAQSEIQEIFAARSAGKCKP